ncbi:MAG: phenylacetate-CoA oxygenase subunit PaaC [Actinobacteria bacterium]|nr:phenylacetate-CoA oxygenase subunit PaaC [Actinomycetota bacterium]
MTSKSLISLLLAYGDDELILGHRHSEWTGFAPHIEEDVAFSSIAQDEIGHAANYFMLTARLTDDDADRIALGRDADEYRNAVICERSNGDWAYTLARHWLYDTADDIRLATLERSSNTELAQLATKMRREERYHLIHADMWMKRVAHGPVEGRSRIETGLSSAFAEAIGLFEPIELEAEAVDEGWLPTPSFELKATFIERASNTLDDLGLPTDVRADLDESAEFVASSSGDLIASPDGGDAEPAQPTGLGGRSGEHTGDFDQLWGELTKTYRQHPGATW